LSLAAFLAVSVRGADGLDGHVNCEPTRRLAARLSLGRLALGDSPTIDLLRQLVHDGEFVQHSQHCRAVFARPKANARAMVRGRLSGFGGTSPPFGYSLFADGVALEPSQRFDSLVFRG